MQRVFRTGRMRQQHDNAEQRKLHECQLHKIIIASRSAAALPRHQSSTHLHSRPCLAAPVPQPTIVIVVHDLKVVMSSNRKSLERERYERVRRKREEKDREKGEEREKREKPENRENERSEIGDRVCVMNGERRDW